MIAGRLVRRRAMNAIVPPPPVGYRRVITPAIPLRALLIETPAASMGQSVDCYQLDCELRSRVTIRVPVGG